MKLKFAVMIFFDYVILALTVIGNRMPDVSDFNAVALYISGLVSVFVINALIMTSGEKKEG